MKYSVIYKRKVQVEPYESMDIGLTAEFDTASTPVEEGFNQVRNQVDQWIEEERKRLMEEGE